MLLVVIGSSAAELEPDTVGLDAYTDFVEPQHIRGYEAVAKLPNRSALPSSALTARITRRATTTTRDSSRASGSTSPRRLSSWLGMGNGAWGGTRTRDNSWNTPGWSTARICRGSRTLGHVAEQEESAEE
jgi:hypothetical protein